MRNWLCVLLTLTILGCSSSEDQSSTSFWFDDQAQQRGVHFRHQSGATGDFYLPEIMGGGVAVGDFNNDTHLDIFFVQSGSMVDAESTFRHELYLNAGNGSFELAQNATTPTTKYGIGVTAGDYDNDGDVDLYITNVGPNTLLRNEGEGAFVDRTEASGLGEPGFGSSATFADFDEDGWLDLFVVNYLDWSVKTELECYDFGTGIRNYCDPSNYNRPTPDLLFRNNQDGTFTDVTVAAGISTARGNGLGTVAADFNQDGLLDIAVANDRTFNHLWINQGSMHFKNLALEWGSAMDEAGIAKAGMGIVAADFDQDTDPDLLIVNIEGETDSYFQNEKTYFKVATPSVGLTQTSRGFTRFGTVLSDFNNDGNFDLFLANGRVNFSTESEVEDPYAESNVLFTGTPAGKFLDGSKLLHAQLTTRIHTSRGAAQGDLDGDGRVDVVVVNRDSRPYVLMNTAVSAQNWLQVRLINSLGRDAHHSRVDLEQTNTTHTRYLSMDGSYLSTHSPWVHFAVEDSADASDLVVTWEDGSSDRFSDLLVNQRHTLVQGKGTPQD